MNNLCDDDPKFDNYAQALDCARTKSDKFMNEWDDDKEHPIGIWETIHYNDTDSRLPMVVTIVHMGWVFRKPKNQWSDWQPTR